MEIKSRVTGEPTGSYQFQFTLTVADASESKLMELIMQKPPRRRSQFIVSLLMRAANIDPLSVGDVTKVDASASDPGDGW